MPNESTHVPGKERVTRFATARRFEAGPGTSFIDHFNKTLMPGIEMSGGYGLFQPGGRLPAHFHDFDESICIIEGTAVCIVEGRRYQQSGCNTALQPRGRVHYFINETQKPMAMIWVYAGPTPERVVVDEICATVEGNPWKENGQGVSARKFVVALTADFYDAAGALKFRDIGLSVLAENPKIEQRVVKEHRKQIGADQIRDAQGVIVLTPDVTAESVSNPDNLLVMARFGVGYDSVDVKACTAADVLVTITTGAVDRPVAEATIGWMMALGHNVRIKDNLVRTGKWDERPKHMGRELRDRTLGVIGLGGIAQKLIELLCSFGMKQPLAFDPFVTEATASKLGVRLVSLEELLGQADFVSIHCPLTEKTRGLVGARELALMKPDAYLLNTARGGIVDEDALYKALKNGALAGAALDCFAQEPVTSPSRFGELDNVLLAPHSIAWTYEMFRDIGRAACQVMVDLSLGTRPRGVLNPEVFEQPRFKAKWQRFRKQN